jgi:hypothetical protein
MKAKQSIRPRTVAVHIHHRTESRAFV